MNTSAIRSINDIKGKIILNCFIEKNAILIKWINKCPAVILAISRTDRVIGRINNLVSSMITIRGDSIIGDPFGTKWLINVLGVFTIFAEIINMNMVMARGKTIDIIEFIVNE